MQLTRVSDDDLFLMHRAYFDYNEALWTKLVVEPAAADRRFRLSVEDTDFDGDRKLFIASLRRLFNCYEDNVFRAAEAADRIARFKKLAAPGSFGILAACVLIASRMAADGRFSAAAYYPRFNQDLLDSNNEAQPKRFDKLREKWVELARTIGRKKLGELVIPKNPERAPIRNRVNINYPLSQCLFRKTDIEKLGPQFREWAENGVRGDEAFTKLLLHVRYHRNVSAALTASLEASSKDPDLREAYCDALDDLIVDTTRHVVVARRVISPKLNADSAGVARLRLAPERQPDSSYFYDLILELQSEQHWTPAEFRCEAANVIGNTVVEIDGRRYRYLGADPQVFFEDGLEIVTGRGTKLPSYARVVFVASRQYETELLGFANAIADRDSDVRDSATSLRLLERFSSLCAIRFTFSAKGIPESGLPAFLARYDIAAPAKLQAIGGLKIDRDYLIGCPPRLELSWDATDGDAPSLYCDDIELKARQLADRIEVDLSAFANERGRHYVTSSDPRLALTFQIVDPDPVVKLVPQSGSFNAMYFGPQFLHFVYSASDFRKARRYAQSPGANIALMSGAWVVCGDDGND